ncbi:MAG TPA: glycosyltransferase 87 family protein [Amnibacterium sp.]|uniref:glycosyltransferase 87 family protein n=1 Tax=Amnibacterium sp. TaxID=1872496 RepID=UPI002F94AA39
MSGSGGRRSRPLGLVVLIAAFVLLHGLLGVAGLVPGLGGPWADPTPFGDVISVYRFWIDYWHQNGQLVGIDTPWVYPLLALVPMLAVSVAGDAAYGPVWVVLVTLLDVGALVLVARRSRRLAWWWVLFTACLGPVAIGRIDAVALPIAIAGVLVIGSRPLLATVLLSVATWVKVWPAAVIAALLVAGKRTAAVITGVAFTSAVVIGGAVALGAGRNVFSFVAAQTGRGLQVEAPVTGLWLIDVLLRVPGASVYYDRDILTFQVAGVGVTQTAAVMTAVLAVGALIVLGLALLARLRGGRDEDVVALTAFGLVSAFLALNKVGSPQYLTWFVAPILLGLLTTRRFRFPAIVVPIMAVLTQLVYPWGYSLVVNAAPIGIIVLELRNLLEVVLLAWTIGALLRTRAETTPGTRPQPERLPDRALS